MTTAQRLERRYRRLIALYPRRFRHDHEEEMIAVLMDGARDGQRWPRPSEIRNLLHHSADDHLSQGPPPDRLARRNPRTVIAIRVLVMIWLVVLTVILCQYSLWGLTVLIAVAAHAYYTARTVAYLRGGNAPGPHPSA